MPFLMQRESATTVTVELSIVMQMDLGIYDEDEFEDEHKRYLLTLEELSQLQEKASEVAEEVWHHAVFAKELERHNYTYLQLLQMNRADSDNVLGGASENLYKADEDLFMYFERLKDLHEFIFMVDEARDGRELGCPFSPSSETTAPLATDG